MPTENKIKLPENHIRSLSVTAHHVENSIDDVEQLLKGNRKDKLTEKIIKSLDDEIRGKILELVNMIRIKNETMFKDLILSENTLHEDRIVRSKISHIWTLLCDSTPESLRGYGKLSPGQAELLHHHINNLLETVNELQPLIM